MHNSQRWNPSKYPSTDAQKNKLWPIHTTEFHSAIQMKHCVLQHGQASETLSKRSYTQKVTHRTIPFIGKYIAFK